MPFNGETILKEGLGGSETAAYFLAKELAARGHRVTLFTNTDKEGEWDGVKYLNVGLMAPQHPLGARFQYYAQNTPSDVLIVQRVPHILGAQTFAAKVIMSWQHDLALRRFKPPTWQGLWNCDAVLAVSEWHKKQINEAWGVALDHIEVAHNGCDFPPEREGLVELPKEVVVGDGRINLLYTSRPERGLENFLRPEAIMEQLAKTGKDYHLYVCNYQNVTQEMAPYYQACYERIEEMPNVTNLGHLTKDQLRVAMRVMDALVYPSNFEETSCITAMEAAQCGLPVIASQVGALPETTQGGGVVLIPLNPACDDDSMLPGVAKGVDVEAFVKAIRKLENVQWKEARRREQLLIAPKYTWSDAANTVERVARRVFKSASPEAKAKHLLRMSDIYALKEYAKEQPLSELGAIGDLPYYDFAFQNRFAEHYAEYYQYEKDRGVNYGPESLDGNPRFEYVARRVGALPAGVCVLDYGCAHGHYTINLAKRFPDRTFVGVDLAQSNIDTARKWAEDEKLTNVMFYQGGIDGDSFQGSADALALRSFDAIIAAEVLEHVAEPWKYVDVLGAHLSAAGEMILTTPYGAWEAQGYAQHPGWRAHLHHFDREDLHDCFGMHPRYNVTAIPAGMDNQGDVLGSYVTTFGKPEVSCGMVNYHRKLSELAPRQTLSVCIIAHNAESTLRKCLESVKDVADEIIVAVDEKTTDRTREIAAEYVRGFSPATELLFDQKSPLEIGFDAARNGTIAKAKGDWILWIDADEELFFPGNVFKYLRTNQFDAYAMAQHHFTVQPDGLLRTDYPTRLFRNGRGIKFFGVVHEHPEKDLNKGIGQAMMIHDVSIAHGGYSTEQIRRGRFKRNIGLLVRDRKTYPDRKLGKFLWLRDLAQMCGYEMEQNGNNVTRIMRERAKEGIKMWEGLLELGEYRMLIDGMDFYSTCVRVLTHGQGGFDLGMKLDASKLNGGPHVDQQPLIGARFMSRDHAERFITGLLKERVADYESKYY